MLGLGLGLGGVRRAFYAMMFVVCSMEGGG